MHIAPSTRTRCSTCRASKPSCRSRRRSRSGCAVGNVVSSGLGWPGWMELPDLWPGIVFRTFARREAPAKSALSLAFF